MKRSIIPSSDHGRIDLPSLLGSVQNSCNQSEYGNLINKPTTAEVRNAFVLKKLNRPFFFANLKGQNDKSFSIGRLSDVKELICLSAVLSGGFSENGGLKESVLPADFVEAALNLPNANFAVLDMMISSWKDGSRDPRLAQLIFSHPAINIYTAEEVVKAPFEKILIELPAEKLFPCFYNRKFLPLTPGFSERFYFRIFEEQRFPVQKTMKFWVS
jgi:hypothetical protein